MQLSQAHSRRFVSVGVFVEAKVFPTGSCARNPPISPNHLNPCSVIRSRAGVSSSKISQRPREPAAHTRICIIRTLTLASSFFAARKALEWLIALTSRPFTRPFCALYVPFLFRAPRARRRSALGSYIDALLIFLIINSFSRLPLGKRFLRRPGLSCGALALR